MTNKPLKVGIISANWGVHGHLPAWRGLPDVEVVGICTAHRETAEKAARAHNIPRAYWDYNEMMKDPEIDIVNIGSRPPIRYDMVMSALRHGKHVYNSIPFGANLKQSAEMLALQRASGRVGQVDAQFQWVPAISRMREMIDEGFLGELFSVACHVHIQLVNAPPAYDQFAYKWLADTANAASGLRNMGAHGLHALVYLFGEISEVVGEGETFVKEWRFADGRTIRPQTADTGHALLRFKRGGIGQLSASWAVADATGVFIEAFGSRGRLVIRSVGFPGTLTTKLYAGEVTKHDGHVEREMEIPERLLGIPGSTLRGDTPNKVALPMGRAFTDMRRAINDGGDAAPSFQTAHHVQATMEAIHLSQRSRAWTPVDEHVF